MKRFEAQQGMIPASLLGRYASAVQRFKSREDRFSSRVLMQFVASAPAEGFAVKAQAEGLTEILLYDEIGYWGVTAKDFVMALASIGPGPIRLRINSPGGDVFDGLAIYNALRARAEPVTVVVDGIAASAASVVAMAGKTIEMPEQAMLMIHNCWGVCIGNRNDMIEMAAVQEKIDGQMAEVYAKKCAKPVGDMAAAMDAETYYTSTEAKAVGLCDAIIEPADAQASAAVSALRPLASTVAARLAAKIKSAALPDYDPDGDGDNDAQEALTLIQAAADMLEDACDALMGVDEDGAGDEDAAPVPVVPGASVDAPGSVAVTDSAQLAAKGLATDRRRRLARLAAAEAA